MAIIKMDLLVCIRVHMAQAHNLHKAVCSNNWHSNDISFITNFLASCPTININNTHT